MKKNTFFSQMDTLTQKNVNMSGRKITNFLKVVVKKVGARSTFQKWSSLKLKLVSAPTIFLKQKYPHLSYKPNFPPFDDKIRVWSLKKVRPKIPVNL